MTLRHILRATLLPAALALLAACAAQPPAPPPPPAPAPVPEEPPPPVDPEEAERAARASMQAIVDAPVMAHGLLPDARPDRYPALPLLADEADGYGRLAPWLLRGEPYRIETLPLGRRQVGTASWYGQRFHGRRTASGEIFDMRKLTAAHMTLPLPSHVRVTNLGNGRSVIVRVNDRGPFHSSRIIDLSREAARQLDIHGLARVRIESVEQGRSGYHRAGRELPDQTVHAVLIGNFSDSHVAHALQSRLMTQLPAGVPISIRREPGPVLAERVEVGPLVSRAEAELLIRGLRAIRVDIATDQPRLTPYRLE